MDTQESPNTNASEKLEEVQSELQCTICHDYFVQASTLSCSHSFCFNCINVWRKKHSDCPVCRQEILGMAPSRALDNMVAALVNRTNSQAQASLQQYGAWRSPNLTTTVRHSVINFHDNTDESDDSDSENDFWSDDEEEESYSDGSYDAEEEEIEEEEGDDEDWEDEEDDDSGSCDSNSDDIDDEEMSDDDEYQEHAKRSNENNPNNEEYWKLRGWASRPDNWKDLVD